MSEAKYKVVSRAPLLAMESYIVRAIGYSMHTSLRSRCTAQPFIFTTTQVLDPASRHGTKRYNCTYIAQLQLRKGEESTKEIQRETQETKRHNNEHRADGSPVLQNTKRDKETELVYPDMTRGRGTTWRKEETMRRATHLIRDVSFEASSRGCSKG